MKAATALAVALLALSAHAGDMIARSDNDSVRLTDQPCTSEAVLVRLNQGKREDYRAASATVSGAPFAACWRPLGSNAHLVYEDGDHGLIPLTDFKPALDV